MPRLAVLLFMAGLAACDRMDPAGTIPSTALISAAPIGYIPHRDARNACAIVSVVDGDTIKLDCGARGGNVRLVGFDTPETFRPKCDREYAAGMRAKRALEGKLRAATVIGPTFEGTDKYGRALVRLTLDGRPLADDMVAEGHARAYDGGRRAGWC